MSFEWLLVYTVPFVVILTVIVFVHELGHYLLAKKNGVKVEVFSIGFGPEIFGFNDRSGTRWKFSYIPLGGYVRMFSDIDASSKPDVEMLKNLTDEEKSYSHHYKTVWQRIQISIAGPAANYIFGILILAILFITYGQNVPTEEPVIGFVAPDSAAAKAEIQSGDKIVSFDGKEITGFTQLTQVIRQYPSKLVSVVIERSGEKIEKTITPASVRGEDEQGQAAEVGQLGIAPAVNTVHHNIISAVGAACVDAVNMTVQTFEAIFGMLRGTRSADGLSGPIGIAKHIGDMATANVPTFLWFMAILSLNLGFINLLPVPVLDGGHLFFYIIEAVRGRPLSDKAQDNAYKVGLFLILSLMIFTTIKDLGKIQIVQKLISYFS